MTLREKIMLAIQSGNGDVNQAAIAVCRLLEQEIGLKGNGWFDDDEELRGLLSAAE